MSTVQMLLYGTASVGDPDVFGLPGSASGSVRHKYESGSYHHQTKIGRKTLFMLFCNFFMTFYL
jgi:hypothetical protein